jgi:hypothetical protein
VKLIKFLFIYFSFVSAALGSPGAHAPSGEHLDAPHAAHAHSDAGPRIDAFTPSFELVGRLQGSELSMLIDRYDTNEPVLGGTLEVAFNGMKAPARFHADHGDYAVDDPAFLKALAKPGKHVLTFMLTAGRESGRLEGILEVKPDDDQHAHGGMQFSAGWIAGGVLLLVLAAIALGLSRRTSTRGA